MSNKDFDYSNKVKFQQILMEQRLKWEKLHAKNEVEDIKSKIEETNLKTVKWIGDKTMSVLISNWITSVEKLKNKLDTLWGLWLSPIAIAQINNYFKEAIN